jgi:hypothetical protein
MHNRGGGVHRCPAGAELAGVHLEVGEEKGTRAVLVEVKAAPEVNRSGSMTRGPQRRMDDANRQLRGRYGYRLGQEAAGRSVGGVVMCFTQRGKHDEGERKERGAAVIGQRLL